MSTLNFSDNFFDNDDSSSQVPDSVTFPDELWQRLRRDHPIHQPEEDNSSSDNSLMNLMGTSLEPAAEEIKKILPCLPEKERNRFIREFGAILYI